MEWYKLLGFKKNPFNINVLKNDFKFVNLKKEADELIYRISSGSMIFIYGPEGSGKTSLLKYAIENFKGKGKVVYIDANNLNRRLDIRDYIEKKPKGMILLIDNIQYLTRKNNDRIKFYFDEDRLRSVVFTTTNKDLVKFSDSIVDRIGDNIISLKPFTEISTKNILESRLTNNKLLDDSVVKTIYLNSRGNMNLFFKNCENVCKFMVNNESDTVSKKELDELLIKKTSSSKINKNVDYCLNCGEKLTKINGVWRCDVCDLYCMNCGALVEDEDKLCPECGAEFKII